MKFRFMFAVFALIAMVGLTSNAKAQVVGVPCQAFGNSPFVCIKNNSNWPVAYIDCDGYQVRVVSDGGFIAPRSIGVAKFRQPYCSRVVIYTQDGRARSAPMIDAKNTTIINIDPWNW